jgi:hypothetical protein
VIPRGEAQSKAQTVVLLGQLRNDVHEVYERIAKPARAKDSIDAPARFVRAILPGVLPVA